MVAQSVLLHGTHGTALHEATSSTAKSAGTMGEFASMDSMDLIHVWSWYWDILMQRLHTLKLTNLVYLPLVPWYIMICHDMSWYVMICHDMLWYVMICHGSHRSSMALAPYPRLDSEMLVAGTLLWRVFRMFGHVRALHHNRTSHISWHFTLSFVSIWISISSISRCWCSKLETVWAYLKIGGVAFFNRESDVLIFLVALW